MKRYEVVMKGARWNASFEVCACDAECAAEIVRGISLYDREKSAVMSVGILEEMGDADDADK